GLPHPLPDVFPAPAEPHQQVSAPLRMEVLPSPEHDRDLHLRPLAEEADHMALLRLVVVDSDLRSELDLLDVDLRLVLARELRLLLLLVPVLPVVHDPRDGRVGLGGDLDEVEPLAVRVLESLRRRLDAELLAPLVDQPHLRDAYRVVDPSLRDRTDGWFEPSRSQRTVTKPRFPPLRTTEPLRKRPDPRRCDS